MFYETRGVEPHRQFVLQYWKTNSNIEGSEGRPIYQIVLQEGSPDILYNYELAYSGGADATMVGIENDNGTIGLRYPGFDKRGTYENRSVRFYKGSTLDQNDVDNDGDGYSENQGDCNDSDGTIYPGAHEICGDGIIQDCNRITDLNCTADPDNIDNDGDGYSKNQGDCNDSDRTIYPGAPEICGDGIIQNCNRITDLTCSDVDDPQVVGSGGPDAFGYRYITSDDAGGPAYTWESFTDAAQSLRFSADAGLVNAISMGFFYDAESESRPYFEFYGKKYTGVYIAGNGYLTFTPDSNYSNFSYDGQGFPSVDEANNLIAPLWLGGQSAADASAQVNVVYETLGTEPQRRFVMEFTYNSTGSEQIAYQVVFFEGENTIQFNYKEINSLGADYLVAGIENSDGTVGLRYAALQPADEIAERSVLFYRGDPPVAQTPEPGSGRANIYIPLVMTGNWQTSVTLLNDSSSETVTGTLYGHDSSGEVVVSSDEIVLDPLARYEGSLNDYFGEVNDSIAYLSFVADIDAVVGSVHFKVDNAGMTGAYPALSHAAASGTLYLSNLKVGDDGWENIVSLVNTSSEQCTVSVEFNNGASKSISLQPGQQFYFYPPGDMEVWSAGRKRMLLKDTTPTPTNAVIHGGEGLIGAALYYNGEQLSALALDNNASEQIIYPYLLDSFAWWGGLVLQNPQIASVDTTFAGYSGGGGTADLALNSSALGSLETQIKLSGNLLTSGSGWLQVDAASPIVGGEFFGTFDGKQMASISTGRLQGKSGIFSNLRSEEEGGWDGLVLVNPGVNETPVTLLAYRGTGEIVAEAHPVLPAHGQLISSVSTLFQGSDISSAEFIRFAADNDIVGLMFNGRNYKVNGYPMGELEALPALRLATTGDRY